MKNIAAKLSPEEYEKNFAELHPALTANQATAEANRCLFCFDSPCMNACPTHIDIATFIKKIATGNVRGSAKTILESNWIALTCAKACPVDELCEGACVYNERGENPIEIGRLQRYAIDRYFEAGGARQTEVDVIVPVGPDARNVLYTLVFGLGAALAGLAGLMQAPILTVQIGMGENILILAFVVIVIGGIGSIRGALVGAVLVGAVDTLGRTLLQQGLRELLPAQWASAAGPALASIAVYLFMAAVLVWRPQGLFGARG